MSRHVCGKQAMLGGEESGALHLSSSSLLQLLAEANSTSPQDCPVCPSSRLTWPDTRPTATKGKPPSWLVLHTARHCAAFWPLSGWPLHVESH